MGKSPKPDKRQLQRTERQTGHDPETAQDRRSPFQRDRDRILYGDYFRRLAGVTQVASAEHGSVFHNRLTHSLKVGQVARRLAERILLEHPDLSPHISPDVVEAAALAHDLGHPPFGHVAEKKLCELADDNDAGLRDGFEGNAQTFRILTRLSVHRARHGLNLCRATLAATLKYPWRRSEATDTQAPPKHRRKYSTYDDDTAAFTFAMEGMAEGKNSLEAQIMDQADSITYSVHDLEDFVRAGLIPIERLRNNKYFWNDFILRWGEAEGETPGLAYAKDPKNFETIQSLLLLWANDSSQPGSEDDAVRLERFRSQAITLFLGGISIDSEGGAPRVKVSSDVDLQCSMLHRFVRDFVINSPRLATQQAGQVRVVETLFQFFVSALKAGKAERIPLRFAKRASELLRQTAGNSDRARLAIDIVASMTEAEAITFFKRVNGHHAGSLTDLV